MNLARLLESNFAPGATRMRLVTRDGIGIRRSCGRSLLRVEADLLRQIAFEAFRDISFLFRTSHLEGWAGILDDANASPNDRYAAATLLANAAVSAEMVLPACQDTGTATVLGLKGEEVATGADDEAALEAGIRQAYATCNLRFSQVAPVSLFDDRQTGTNLPAQIDIHAVAAGGPGGREYRLLFVAKGGGSANKTIFSQENRTLLEDGPFAGFLRQRIGSLGVAGCPPYHIAVVVGGTSAERNLEVLKLVTAGALEHLPDIGEAARWGEGRDVGAIYRDRSWEERLLAIGRETGLGAQFGGATFALDARVLRLPRHAASLPVSIGVSCSAHRNALARVGQDGAWLEDFDRDPARFLDRALPVLERARAGARRIDLDRPIDEVRRQLAGLPVGAMVLLTGTLVVARDAAHARFARGLREGRGLPEYLKRHPVYYAGPAQTPPGHVIGSFGPTTGQRMDSYAGSFMREGASLVMLAKGNRSKAVAEACREFGGFSLGTIGGAAALLAGRVTAEEIIDHADLAMEAVRRITVRELPAFVVIDDRGTNLYDRRGSPAEDG